MTHAAADVSCSFQGLSRGVPIVREGGPSRKHILDADRLKVVLEVWELGIEYDTHTEHELEVAEHQLLDLPTGNFEDFSPGQRAWVIHQAVTLALEAYLTDCGYWFNYDQDGLYCQYFCDTKLRPFPEWVPTHKIRFEQISREPRYIPDGPYKESQGFHKCH